MDDFSRPVGSEAGGTMPALSEVRRFLTDVHGEPVEGLEPLSGGYWSAAYGYRSENRDLVARFGAVRSGFEADRDAMAFAGPDLPIPEVLEIGEGLGMSYAISVRAFGQFLEEVPVAEAPAVAPLLVGLLGALFRRRPNRVSETAWQKAHAGVGHTWREWLIAGMMDDPARPVHGWRATLARDPALDRLVGACEARFQELLDACPERRDLIHGDLLHRNVLVADDASGLNAVFSWKCSVLGDFLFDTAWCTFWSAVHPGIAAADVWRGVSQAGWANDDSEPLADAPARHHCYELQIGVTHLGWYAWTGDSDGLQSVATRTAEILERGPLTLP